jgi:hypothetical protein
VLLLVLIRDILPLYGHAYVAVTEYDQQLGGWGASYSSATKFLTTRSGLSRFHKLHYADGPLKGRYLNEGRKSGVQAVQMPEASVRAKEGCPKSVKRPRSYEEQEQEGHKADHSSVEKKQFIQRPLDSGAFLIIPMAVGSRISVSDTSAVFLGEYESSFASDADPSVGTSPCDSPLENRLIQTDEPPQLFPNAFLATLQPDVQAEAEAQAQLLCERAVEWHSRFAGDAGGSDGQASSAESPTVSPFSKKGISQSTTATPQHTGSMSREEVPACYVRPVPVPNGDCLVEKLLCSDSVVWAANTDTPAEATRDSSEQVTATTRTDGHSTGHSTAARLASLARAPPAEALVAVVAAAEAPSPAALPPAAAAAAAAPPPGTGAAAGAGAGAGAEVHSERALQDRWCRAVGDLRRASDATVCNLTVLVGFAHLIFTYAVKLEQGLVSEQ